MATLVNGVSWALYLYRVDRSELGHIQYWIMVGLAMTFMFNLPIKHLYFVYNTLGMVIAAFVNAASISYVLIMSLVLLHAISAPFELSIRWFYVPKLIMIVPVFVIMFIDQFFVRRGLRDRFENKLYLDEPVGTHSLDFTILLSVMSLYFVALVYYGFLSLTIPGRENNEKLRFSSVAIAMTLFLTTATALSVVLPFES